VAAQSILGCLDETVFVELDVDCDADLILGYEWLRAHDLAFLTIGTRPASVLRAAAPLDGTSVSTSSSTSQRCQHRALLLPQTFARFSG
jgi:hypothetical protein